MSEFPNGDSCIWRIFMTTDRTVSNFKKLASIRVAALCTVLTLAAHAQATLVSVGNMNAADWTQTTVTLEGTQGTLNVSTPATGGNTGSFWQHRFDDSAGNVGLNRFRVTNIFNGTGYDPASQGALDSLIFTFDMIRVFSPFADASAGFLIPSLEQGGHLYRRTLGPTAVTAGAWQTQTFIAGLASEWLELGTGLNPDFSENGDAIHFGYQVSIGASCPAGATCTATTVISGLDNFRVEALAAVVPNEVPEPSSLSLLILSLSAFGLVARRRQAATKPTV